MPDEQKVTRKLFAILIADDQGYRRLMGEHEYAIERTLTTYREQMSVINKNIEAG
ncbi:hypothetical protein ACFL2E_04975 [Thermodesulfobacteriota bacterium]